MNASRLALAASFATLAVTPAFAHPGHVAAEGGHSHFLAFGAAGLAVAIAIGGIALVVRARKR